MAHRSSSNAYAEPAGGSLTVTAPAGIQDGDILVFFCYAYRAGTLGTLTFPAGFTTTASHTPSAGVAYAVAWKRASSESGDYTATAADAYSMSAWVGCYSGRKATGDPVDAYSNTPYVVNDTTVRGAGITVAADGADVIWMGCGLGTTLAAPGGMSSRASQDGGTFALEVADLLDQSAGGTGDKDGTLDGASESKHAFLVAIDSFDITGTGVLQIAGITVSGAGHSNITGTGALQIGDFALAGTGHYDITGTGALQIGNFALSGTMWQDSAHLRHLGGKAMLWGAKGRAEIRGLKGKASM